MTTPRELTAALMEAMEFSLDDLNFNRNGQLSEGQKRMLGAMGGQQMPFAIIPLVGMALLTLISGIAVVYLLSQTGFNFSQMVAANASSGTVVAVFIVVLISTVMAYRYYPGSRGLSNGAVHSIEGYVKKDVEGIGPNKQMWRNELAFVVGAGIIGTMFVRNVFRGRGISTQKEDYILHYGYRLKVGKRTFHVVKPIGQAFETGVLYRVYYLKTYPMPMLISGEALDASSPISAG